MDFANFTEEEARELFDAQTHIWNHVLNFLHSMALKCAIQLGIPDAIHKNVEPVTLPELAVLLSIHPNKVSSLSRLMNLLVSSNFFSKKSLPNGKELRFALTSSSKLLLKDHPLSLASFAFGIISISTEAPHHLSSWFQNEEIKSPFDIAYGRSFWEQASHEPQFNEYFNKAMESDSRFVTSLLVNSNYFKGLVEGVDSLVDVGGGNGTTAKAILKAYPRLKCIVLDLPHVVEGLQDENDSNLVYVEGDMFKMMVPHADVVLLKWILHAWSNDDCIRILQRCKEAISNTNGKIVIIDIVLKPHDDSSMLSKAQNLMDMQLMSLIGEGKERTEEEWKKLFVAAGFRDYKILPILGLRSLIELYP